ncbi:high mobility group protein [Diaporthe amygdali]|uniref:high mobility group protein n=1 Tax=Phomopsis amygdali TaxID=1214568 RepID=UPI0022FE2735|nr:high mobility group protein [Diaporthe amygdali]KAJ0121665.1 high mobility group protein [Diaporthe amygdali]
MSPKLQEVFGELGISQYLDVFLDQGFDTWETILDITESDLDALGVKLGHRRKLQRRIANARGVAPDAALASPTRASVEDARTEVQKTEGSALSSTDIRENGNGVVQKRKYRRHPKPDENAPERAPSAYVLFSNKMREDLKGQNLTFTEIAKLVGENWQGLTQAEKEPYERDAQAAKEKYNRDLAEYKKTPDYKKYLLYLQEFKAKHANHAQDKEVSKRVRLSDPNIGEATVVNGHSGRIARAGSIGDQNGEPPARRQRIGSIVSNGESYYAASVASFSQRTPGDESVLTSPATGYFDRRLDRRRDQSPGVTGSPRDSSAQPPAPLRRDPPSYTDGSRADSMATSRSLPPLSDVFEGRPMLNGAAHLNEAPTQNIGLLPRGLQTASPANTPSLSGSESRPPSLKKEQSSAGSMSSASSAYSSFPRTPIEGPLPIHALLSGGKQFNSYDAAFAANPAIQGRSMSPDDRPTILPLERAPSDPTPVNPPLPHINGETSTGIRPGSTPGVAAECWDVTDLYDEVNGRTFNYLHLQTCFEPPAQDGIYSSRQSLMARFRFHQHLNYHVHRTDTIEGKSLCWWSWLA